MLQDKAKVAAKIATRPDRVEIRGIYKARSIILNLVIAKIRKKGNTLPEGVGKFTRAMDMALPGEHTRKIYDGLGKRDACLLAELRTNKSKLRGYLNTIGAIESGFCKCGRAIETVRHFLFACQRWEGLRSVWLASMGRINRGSLGKALGGKTVEDSEPWAPNLRILKETLKFVKATGRWEEED